MKDFSDLKSFREKLKEDERQRAIEKAVRERRERIERENAVEFRSAVKDVTPIPESDRYVWRPAREAELRASSTGQRPRLPEDEVAAVLRESMLSDQFDVDGLLDEDPTLSWSAPGVGPDVVKKLRKRHWQVEDELDLHGYTRDLARRMVDAFLRRSSKRGVRCVRIIHGVGYGSAGGEPVLRGMVHSWLVQTAETVAFCVANRSDGGNGALIVLLRPALEADD
ncbi:DNA mismatch repair protein MutS [Massilia sp. WF1]|uniref:Smr/MutS family protein n=1 Tax=unclassified Massilia TaxID=2609279 RepID=UPI00064995D5|nr:MULTISPECIES: Smr/MutS family protein [unclassified Massilia]ALK96601.1 DNA mismatch repair protein MutS [Massilia sp. WG5]KLU36228.1 DNA mismatch repair protein MutS [Massilia sp. WF1]